MNLPPQAVSVFLPLGIGAVCGALAAVWWLNRRRPARRAYRISRFNRRALPGLLDAISDPVLLLDPDSAVIRDVNQATCDLFACTRAGALGARIGQFSFADLNSTPADIPALIQRARAKGPQRFAWQARRTDGTPFWAEATLRCARIGGRSRIVMTARDVSQRIQAEADLVASSDRFRKLIDTVPDLAIHGYLMDGTATYWNETCTRLYGYTAEEAIGRSIFDLIIPPELSEAVRANIQALKLGAANLPPTELVLRRKDGSRIHVYSGYAVSSLPGHPPQFFCLDLDLTERLRTEDERQQLQDQLAQAQKMELVGRLAGGVAHDFNNMLGVIVGYAELAMEQADPDTTVFHDLQEIRKAARRSTDLTRQLLAYARKQPVSPRVLDLNETIGGALNMIRRLIGENLELRWQPAASVWPVRLDPGQLDQILTNLCVNARDAIEGIGALTIQTGTIALPPAALPRGPESPPPGDYTWLSVADNGPGMPRDVLEHIFEPFFTTKEIGRGTGLGLATVYGIVKQNHAHISVDSDPGRGTVFTLHFPRHHGPVDAEPPALPAVDGVSGRQTLLLVEDELSLLSLCRSHLERQGYDVLATDSPAEALQMASAHPGPIHLLITDVVMPEMDGAELSRRLTLMRPGIHTLFMSGYTADVTARHGVSNTGIQFLQKPFGNADLTAKVQALLRSTPNPEVPHG